MFDKFLKVYDFIASSSLYHMLHNTDTEHTGCYLVGVALISKSCNVLLLNSNIPTNLWQLKFTIYMPSVMCCLVSDTMKVLRSLCFSSYMQKIGIILARVALMYLFLTVYSSGVIDSLIGMCNDTA